MCAKCENPTMLSKVTAKNVGYVFVETHCTYPEGKYCKKVLGGYFFDLHCICGSTRETNIYKHNVFKLKSYR